MFAPSTPDKKTSDVAMPKLQRTTTFRPSVNLSSVCMRLNFDNVVNSACMTPNSQMTVQVLPDGPRKASKPPRNINMTPCQLFPDDDDVNVPSER